VSVSPQPWEELLPAFSDAFLVCFLRTSTALTIAPGSGFIVPQSVQKSRVALLGLILGLPNLILVGKSTASPSRNASPTSSNGSDLPYGWWLGAMLALV